MSEIDLRNFIIAQQKSACSGEPGENAIANHLAAFQWYIFEADGTKYSDEALIVFSGYDKIDDLRFDAIALLASLKSELGEEKWINYFERRKSLLDASQR